MRVVLCGDLLFSSRNLKNRLDKRVVDLLVDADAVFANAEFSTPKKKHPSRFVHVFDFSASRYSR